MPTLREYMDSIREWQQYNIITDRAIENNETDLEIQTFDRVLSKMEITELSLVKKPIIENDRLELVKYDFIEKTFFPDHKPYIPGKSVL